MDIFAYMVLATMVGSLTSSLLISFISGIYKGIEARAVRAKMVRLEREMKSQGIDIDIKEGVHKCPVCGAMIFKKI
jgi:hypothetical protein